MDFFVWRGINTLGAEETTLARAVRSAGEKRHAFYPVTCVPMGYIMNTFQVSSHRLSYTQIGFTLMPKATIVIYSVFPDNSAD